MLEEIKKKLNQSNNHCGINFGCTIVTDGYFKKWENKLKIEQINHISLDILEILRKKHTEESVMRMTLEEKVVGGSIGVNVTVDNIKYYFKTKNLSDLTTDAKKIDLTNEIWDAQNRQTLENVISKIDDENIKKGISQTKIVLNKEETFLISYTTSDLSKISEDLFIHSKYNKDSNKYEISLHTKDSLNTIDQNSNANSTDELVLKENSENILDKIDKILATKTFLIMKLFGANDIRAGNNPSELKIIDQQKFYHRYNKTQTDILMEAKNNSCGNIVLAEDVKNQKYLKIIDFDLFSTPSRQLVDISQIPCQRWLNERIFDDKFQHNSNSRCINLPIFKNTLQEVIIHSEMMTHNNNNKDELLFNNAFMQTIYDNANNNQGKKYKNNINIDKLTNEQEIRSYEYYLISNPDASGLLYMNQLIKSFNEEEIKEILEETKKELTLLLKKNLDPKEKNFVYFALIRYYNLLKFSDININNTLEEEELFNNYMDFLNQDSNLENLEEKDILYSIVLLNNFNNFIFETNETKESKINSLEKIYKDCTIKGTLYNNKKLSKKEKYQYYESLKKVDQKELLKEIQEVSLRNKVLSLNYILEYLMISYSLEENIEIKRLTEKKLQEIIKPYQMQCNKANIEKNKKFTIENLINLKNLNIINTDFIKTLKNEKNIIVELKDCLIENNKNFMESNSIEFSARSYSQEDLNDLELSEFITFLNIKDNSSTKENLEQYYNNYIKKTEEDKNIPEEKEEFLEDLEIINKLNDIKKKTYFKQQLLKIFLENPTIYTEELIYLLNTTCLNEDNEITAFLDNLTIQEKSKLFNLKNISTTNPTLFNKILNDSFLDLCSELKEKSKKEANNFEDEINCFITSFMTKILKLSSKLNNDDYEIEKSKIKNIIEEIIEKNLNEKNLSNIIIDSLKEKYKIKIKKNENDLIDICYRLVVNINNKKQKKLQNTQKFLKENILELFNKVKSNNDNLEKVKEKLLDQANKKVILELFNIKNIGNIRNIKYQIIIEILKDLNEDNIKEIFKKIFEELNNIKDMKINELKNYKDLMIKKDIVNNYNEIRIKNLITIKKGKTTNNTQEEYTPPRMTTNFSIADMDKNLDTLTKQIKDKKFIPKTENLKNKIEILKKKNKVIKRKSKEISVIKFKNTISQDNKTEGYNSLVPSSTKATTFNNKIIEENKSVENNNNAEQQKLEKIKKDWWYPLVNKKNLIKVDNATLLNLKKVDNDNILRFNKISNNNQPNQTF